MIEEGFSVKSYNSITDIENVSLVKRMTWIECAILCLFGIFYIDFEIQSKYYIISPFCILLYLSYCCMNAKLRKPIIKYVCACIIVSVLFQILTTPVTISGSGVAYKYFYSNFTQYLLIFFPIVMFYKISRYASDIQQKVFLGVVLITGILLMTAAVKIAEINPDILHSMNQDVLESAGISFQGYNFVYAFTFLVITSVIIFQHSNKMVIKLLSVAAIVYTIYFMSKAQFALSFVTTAISLLYLYYISAKNKTNRVFVVLALGALMLLLPSIMEYLVSVTSDLGVLNVRLREISESLSGNHSGQSDMQARFELYGKCINAFLQSPIQGNSYLPFNGHSTFLLAFAYLGIFGGLFICLLFYKGYKNVCYVLNSKSLYFKPLMCQIILMGITNPINDSPSNFIMLFCICPLLIQKYVSK